MKTRERILRASRRICRRDGFRSLTMRRVADAVGISAPALYRHFEGKEQLFEVLMDEARENFASHLQTSLRARSPLQRFRRASEAYRDFALEQPERYELIFLTRNQEGLLGAPASVESWRESPPPTFQFCIDRVEDCIEDGVFRRTDPVELALTFSAMAHGLVSLWLAGRFGTEPTTFRRLYRRCIEQLIDGAGIGSLNQATS